MNQRRCCTQCRDSDSHNVSLVCCQVCAVHLQHEHASPVGVVALTKSRYSGPIAPCAGP